MSVTPTDSHGWAMDDPQPFDLSTLYPDAPRVSVTLRFEDDAEFEATEIEWWYTVERPECLN